MGSNLRCTKEPYAKLKMKAEDDGQGHGKLFKAWKFIGNCGKGDNENCKIAQC